MPEMASVSSFFVFDRLDIVRLDEPEHIGELTQFFDG